MPNIVTVSELFDKTSLNMNGPLLWKTPIPETRPGIYVIATTPEPQGAGELINPNYLLPEKLQLWNTSQPVVYIGRTKRSIRQRIKEFYKHKHGDRRPHSGGQDIILLQCELWVYWSATNDDAAAENKMIEFFKARVLRLPFGNRVKSARRARNNHN